MDAQDISALIEHAPDHEWVGRAACRNLEIEQLDLFFVEAGRTLSREAVAICTSCPVRRECLDHAYENDIAGGYFGGLSPSKRRSLDHADAVRLIEGSVDA